MKNKCPLCREGKARRDCRLKDEAVICSRCCAEMRGPECSGCPHYEEAMLHAMQRAARAPDGHYIIELNPEVEEAVNCILEQATAENMTKAFGDMQRLLAEHPQDHNVCFGMGVLYCVSGKEDEAIPWLEKAISIFPYMSEAYYNLGIAHKNTGNIGQMIKALQKAVKYAGPEDEDYIEAKRQLEHVQQVIGQNEGVDLDSYVISSEKFDAAYEQMENKQWEAAVKGFREALTYNEKNAPTHGNLGLCLAFLGRKAEALAALDRAIEIDPQYEPAINNRMLAEKMDEGSPIENATTRSVRYALEQLTRKRTRKQVTGKKTRKCSDQNGSC